MVTGPWRSTRYDERGWRIPRNFTVSRKIYELMVAGLTTGQIAKKLDRKPGATAVLAWRIRHPERANAAQKKEVGRKPPPV